MTSCHMRRNTRVSADTTLLAAAWLALSTSTSALEMAGVDVVHEAEVAGEELLLNGAGLRSKFFVRIYVGSLYLSARTNDAVQAVSMTGPKRVSLDILYEAMSPEQITDAWSDGFEANLDEAALTALAPRIKRFNALWPPLKAGDQVVLDFANGSGTSLTVNGQALGSVPGKDFNDAMLRIWLGESPADGDLKRGMLGQ